MPQVTIDITDAQLAALDAAVDAKNKKLKAGEEKSSRQTFAAEAIAAAIDKKSK